MPRTELTGTLFFKMEFADDKEIDDMIDFLNAAKKSGKYPWVYLTHREVKETEVVA